MFSTAAHVKSSYFCSHISVKQTLPLMSYCFAATSWETRFCLWSQVGRQDFSTFIRETRILARNVLLSLTGYLYNNYCTNPLKPHESKCETARPQTREPNQLWTEKKYKTNLKHNNLSQVSVVHLTGGVQPREKSTKITDKHHFC